tara:strand:- start:2454 stop:3170 length:717 start_codon:yes stop_codon:yes gene_type:complete
MKITKSQLIQLIKEETQGEMEFAPLEAARQAYLQEPNDETKYQLGQMVDKLVAPLMKDMGLFWEAEAYYNRSDLIFNNRKVEVSIDPRGAMGRYDVNVSAQVSAMDTDPAFEPIEITIPSMKGVLQFVNDKVFSSTGMVGEPEAQTELPLGKGGLAKEHKVRITKSQLQKIIKEELGEEAESRYPERGSQEEAQYEVMVQMGKFLARLFNEGHNELADEFSQILDQADKAGMRGRQGW